MMNARRLLGLFGLILVVGFVVAYWPTTTGPPTAAEPPEGMLAPHRPELVGPWEEVARVPAERLGRGAIVDLDEYQDTLYIAQRDRWFWVADDAVSEPLGSPTQGSPTWLGAAVAIRGVAGGAVILDRGRNMVSHWRLDGTRGVETDLRPRDGLAVIVDGVAAQADGTLLVSVRRILVDGDGEWIVLRGVIGPARFDTVYRGAKDPREAEAHNSPKLAVAPDGSFLIAPALEWKFISVSRAGTVLGDRSREDGPRWAVPDSIRRQYQTLLERFPPAHRVAHALPATFPPVRALSSHSQGNLLVLVASGPEETHVELLDANAVPISRLWPAPESLSIFLANGAVFRVRETADFTIIERQRLRPAPD